MAEERDRYDEKLSLILRGAAAVFARKGYHQASIRDISAATGVSLAGLYYYVKSKEELLFLVQDHCMTSVLASTESLVETDGDPRRTLCLFMENHLRYFVDNMDEMKVLSHEAQVLTGEYRERVEAKKRRYKNRWMDVLEAVRPEGSVIDRRVATFGLFGMLNWIYNWYDPKRDVDVNVLAAQLAQLFMGGFLRGGSVMDPEPPVREVGLEEVFRETAALSSAGPELVPAGAAGASAVPNRDGGRGADGPVPASATGRPGHGGRTAK